MSFLHPEFLYYMLIPLFILFALLITQKEAHKEYFSEDVINKLRVTANTLTQKSRNILFLIIGILLIIALAEPVIKDGVVKIKAKSADIMIALDISDSMLATDVYPNRLELAKQKALTLLDESPNERIGIVAFAKNSYLVSPLSFDTDAVAFLLRQLDTSSITEKGTDFESVLEIVGKSQVEKEKKYLLILSDGGDKSDFSAEIDIAKDEGITVFVLGLGTKKGSPIKLEDGTFIKHHGEIIVSKLNESISELATKTGGVYIQSTTSSDDIKTMLHEITNISDEKELKSEEIPRYTPLFYYPVALALFLLLIATSSFGKRVNSNAHSIFILFAIMFSNVHVEAGMLDFVELNKANEAYEKEDYEKSAEIYSDYAKASSNAESYYNAGNSFYKQKKYKEAIEAYEKATLETPELRAKNYSNLGNAYVKEQGEGSLQKAIEAYEKSLKLQEDKETRENLEEVKKFLEKQKQDSKDKKSEQNKDKSKKSEDKNGDKKESDENQEKSEQNKDNSKSNESNDKENNPDDMKSQKEKDVNEKKSEQNKDQLDKLEEEDEKKSEQNKDQLDKLENRDNKDESKENSNQASEQKQYQMSEEEEKKWIKALNSKSNTYMYKLNDDKAQTNKSDEKPW